MTNNWVIQTKNDLLCRIYDTKLCCVIIDNLKENTAKLILKRPYILKTYLQYEKSHSE